MTSIQFILMIAVLVATLSVCWLFLLRAVRQAIADGFLRRRLLEHSERCARRRKKLPAEPVAMKIMEPVSTYRYTKEHHDEVGARRAQRRTAARIKAGLPVSSDGVAVGGCD